MSATTYNQLFLNIVRALNEVCREETESTSAPESDNACNKYF